MEEMFERPRVVYNRDAKQLGNDIPTRYVAQGRGAPAAEFEAAIRNVLDRYQPAQYGVVKEIASGSLPKEVVAAFARDLCIYAHRIGTLDGLIAWKAEWYGFDNVIRMAQPTAINWGYWKRELPLAERLIPLAAALGADTEGLPMQFPSMNMNVYLRVRETLNQGGAGLEVALASTFAEAQWPLMTPPLIEGLVRHYGIKRELAEVLTRFAELDEQRGQDRIPILLDIALSKRQQGMVVRATDEMLSVWKWSMDHLAEKSIVSKAA